MRTIEIGAPFSIARIGSTRPALGEIFSDPAASCWIDEALDCEKMTSSFRSAASK
jgi:hypothetical protein